MTRFLALTTLLAACGGSQGLDDARFNTGSTTMVTARQSPVLYAVNVDEGTLGRIDAESGDLDQVDLGSEPTRVARVGDELWVTLRGERSIAIVVDNNGKLEVESTIDVGAEPFGIVATENGKRVYVAVSQQGEVVEFNGKKKTELRRFKVMDDARWLALHPSDRVLYVTGPYGDHLAWIDLIEGTVFTMERPGATRPTDRGDVELQGRFTGDPAFTPSGQEIAFPMLYVDNETSVDVPEDDRPSRDGYGSSGVDVSRMNPSLWVVETDPETGIPELGENDEALVFLADQIIGEQGRSAQVLRSFPSSVQASPNGEEWLVTFEGSAAVAGVRRSGQRNMDAKRGGGVSHEPDVGFDESRGFRGNADPERHGFELRPMRFIAVQEGPHSVAFLGEDAAYVHSWLDRSVARLPMDELHDQLERGDFFAPNPVAFDGRRLTESALDADVAEGRRLFFSAIDDRMAGSGAGVSCSTCHFDGRNDGLTWTLDGQPRQTPSLAGPVQDTAPFTWTDGVSSVADEAMLTTSLRMGGGLERTDAEKIEAYVAWSRLPDVANAGSTSEQVKLGKEVFSRPEVGCNTCHNGAAYTDNSSHALYAVDATQTPTLRGISATAPYFHDGSADSLADVLERSKDGSMGDTSSLSAKEMKALEAYLRSL